MVKNSLRLIFVIFILLSFTKVEVVKSTEDIDLNFEELYYSQQNPMEIDYEKELLYSKLESVKFTFEARYLNNDDKFDSYIKAISQISSMLDITIKSQKKNIYLKKSTILQVQDFIQKLSQKMTLTFDFLQLKYSNNYLKKFYFLVNLTKIYLFSGNSIIFDIVHRTLNVIEEIEIQDTNQLYEFVNLVENFNDLLEKLYLNTNNNVRTFLDNVSQKLLNYSNEKAFEDHYASARLKQIYAKNLFFQKKYQQSMENYYEAALNLTKSVNIRSGNYEHVLLAYLKAEELTEKAKDLLINYNLGSEKNFDSFLEDIKKAIFVYSLDSAKKIDEQLTKNNVYVDLSDLQNVKLLFWLIEQSYRIADTYLTEQKEEIKTLYENFLMKISSANFRTNFDQEFDSKTLLNSFLPIFKNAYLLLKDSNHLNKAFNTIDFLLQTLRKDLERTTTTTNFCQLSSCENTRRTCLNYLIEQKQLYAEILYNSFKFRIINNQNIYENSSIFWDSFSEYLTSIKFYKYLDDSKSDNMKNISNIYTSLFYRYDKITNEKY